MKKIIIITLFLSLVFITTAVSADSLDWRNHTYNGVTGDWTSPVKDQGSCGSCWAFAAIGLVESHLNINDSNPSLDRDLSEQYILSCNDIDAGDCNGGIAKRALYYTRDNGSLPESCFAYTHSDTTPCSNKCGDWEDKLMYNISTVYRYSGIENLSKLKEALDDGPIVPLFDIMNDFYYSTGDVDDGYGDDSWDTNGVYKYDGVSGPSGNLHFVLIVGYNDTPSNPDYDGYWICKNSWGDSWGPWSDGFFGFAYNQTLNGSEMEDYYLTVTLKEGQNISTTWHSEGFGGEVTVESPSEVSISGLSNNNITWSSVNNSIVWSNETVPGGTMNVTFQINASRSISVFNLLITDLDVDIPKENISIEVINAADGTWDGNTESFPSDSGNITIDSSNWSEPWCHGTDPFPITDETIYIEIRFKLDLGDVIAGTYSKSDWKLLYDIV